MKRRFKYTAECLAEAHYIVMHMKIHFNMRVEREGLDIFHQRRMTKLEVANLSGFVSGMVHANLWDQEVTPEEDADYIEYERNWVNRKRV